MGVKQLPRNVGVRNEENPHETPKECCKEGPFTCLTEDEFGKALRAMNANKIPGPLLVSSGLMKCAGNTVVTHLLRVYQKKMSIEICPEEWKDNTTPPSFKGKSDPLHRAPIAV